VSIESRQNRAAFGLCGALHGGSRSAWRKFGNHIGQRIGSSAAADQDGQVGARRERSAHRAGSDDSHCVEHAVASFFFP
jgi:hypothetical protein